MNLHNELVLRVLSNKNGDLSGRRVHRILKTPEKYQNLIYYLHNLYNDIPEDNFTINEVFYRIKHNIDSRPVCPICGNHLKYIFTGKYNKTCNNRNCITKSTRETTFEKHGYYSSWADKTTHQKCIDSIDKEKSLEKYKRTCLEKYGAENIFSKESSRFNEIRQVFQKKYGTNSPRNIIGVEEKIQETNLKRYGYKYGLSNPEIINKRKETIKSLYGQEITNIFQVEEIKRKMRSTWIQKYGVDNPTKNKKVLCKAFQTMKFNGTLGKSKEESIIFEFLKDIYKDDIERHKKDSLYPYVCDFYIKSKELYIEFQGHWTHGNHLFNKDNKEDLKLLEFAKEKAKTSKYYNNFIKAWTIKDPEKFKTAKSNNINFLSIYNLDLYKIKDQQIQQSKLENLVNIIESFDVYQKKQIIIEEIM